MRYKEGSATAKVPMSLSLLLLACRPTAGPVDSVTSQPASFERRPVRDALLDDPFEGL